MKHSEINLQPNFMQNNEIMNYFIINVSVMNIYQEPSFNSPVVTQALLGETCRIINRSDHWVQIKQMDGYEGWANDIYGTIQSEKYEANYIYCEHMGVIVNDKNLPIRTVNYGSMVQAKRHGNQYDVLLPDHQQGIIKKGLRAHNLPPTRESIVSLAMSFIGIPYQWGGKSTQGFDCSGFVQTVFKSHGINFPRDSYQQAEALQKTIKIDKAKKGDLLFFAKKGQINHVAISLGSYDLVNARGWVRIESTDPEHTLFSQKLRDLFVKALSVEDVLNS